MVSKDMENLWRICLELIKKKIKINFPFKYSLIAIATNAYGNESLN